MINILIDCKGREVRVDRNGEQYFYAKANKNLSTAAIVAWQTAHELSHDHDERVISYFGIAPDGRELNFDVDIGCQAFCIMIDNFGSAADLLTSQTNLAIQLLIHGANQQQLRNENK